MLDIGSVIRIRGVDWQPDASVVVQGPTQGALVDDPRAVVALKCRRSVSNADREREVCTWSRAHHPNILPLWGVYDSGPLTVMVSPWMANGTLAEYLSECPNAGRRTLALQVAEAVVFLHDVMGTMHGDINCDNVLISDDHKALLRNFECSAPANMTQIEAHGRETGPTAALDVYAYAWLVFQMFTDISPKQIARDWQFVELVCQGTLPSRPGPESLADKRGLDDVLWDICVRCWQLSPMKRPRMRDVVAAMTTEILRPSWKLFAPGLVMCFDNGGRQESVTVVRHAVRGSQAEIFEGKTMHGQRVALKVLNVRSPVVEKKLQREIAAWRQLDHPNVLPPMGIDYSGSAYHLVLIAPWAANGDLAHYLFNHPNADRIKLLRQIAQGLEYLHAHQVVHGDLKSANVLISGDENALLVDFGLSTVIGNRRYTVNGSTEEARPCANLAGPSPSKIFAADTYAYGCIAMEVFIGPASWTDPEPKEFLLSQRLPAAMRTAPFGLRVDIPEVFEIGIWTICKQCCEVDLENRPSMGDVVRAYDERGRSRAKREHTTSLLGGFGTARRTTAEYPNVASLQNDAALSDGWDLVDAPIKMEDTGAVMTL